jgi:hypothetical protein
MEIEHIIQVKHKHENINPNTRRGEFLAFKCSIPPPTPPTARKIVETIILLANMAARTTALIAKTDATIV